MNIYDEIADMFMSSLAAEVAGLTRAEFMATLREKWPDEQAAREAWEQIKKRGEAFAAKAEADAAARGRRVVGIGYPVKK